MVPTTGLVDLFSNEETEILGGQQGRFGEFYFKRSLPRDRPGSKSLPFGFEFSLPSIEKRWPMSKLFGKGWVLG